MTSHDQAKRIRKRYAQLFGTLPQKMRWGRWRHLVGLAALCRELPKKASGLEIGSFAGESSVLFLECGVASLVCLDCWDLRDWKEGKAERVDAAEETFDLVARLFGSRIRKLKARSSEGMAALQEEGRAFDFVYIDADHSRAGVLADIEGARRLLRPGGILCGHDYGRSLHPGVTEAVLEALGKPDKVFADYSWLKRLP